MNRATFYDEVRGALFDSVLLQSQVDGLDRLLDIWDEFYASTGSAEELAYDLGTAFHETARTMQPITEYGGRSYFNKYEPGTRIGKVLGNTRKGDGYRFRGEGDVMNTGRRNARVATKRLNEVFGLGIDLVRNPEMRGDPFISAHSLFLGNREGWWTGKKIADFIDGIDEEDDEDFREFVKSRGIVNGTDRAKDIARHALAFEKALKAAEYGKAKAPLPDPAPAKKPTTSQTKPTIPAKRGWGKAALGALLGVIVIVALVLAVIFNIPN